MLPNLGQCCIWYFQKWRTFKISEFINTYKERTNLITFKITFFSTKISNAVKITQSFQFAIQFSSKLSPNLRQCCSTYFQNYRNFRIIEISELKHFQNFRISEFPNSSFHSCVRSVTSGNHSIPIFLKIISNGVKTTRSLEL